MKYLSLFSGIGGFELGIQQAYEELQNDTKKWGQGETKSVLERSVSDTVSQSNERQYPHCIGYSEIDKYACQIYDKHFNHKNYGNITKLDEKELPDFDLLVGGFPCQAFSIAGKRMGFEDTRGTLFFDIARIIREKQPRLLLLENVKGLLSHDKGSTFYTIISTLDELGYDCQWQVLNSKNFGVPQNRERVFIVGHLRGTSRPEVFPIGGTNGETDEPDRISENANPRELSRTLLARDYKDPKLVQINQPKHSNDRVYSEEGISPTLNTMQGGNRQPFIKTNNKTYGKLDDRTLEGKEGFQKQEGDLLGVQREKENRDTSHRQGLAQQQAGKSTGSVQELPLSSAQSNQDMQAEELRQEEEKIRILRETQPEIQEVGESTSSETQSVLRSARIRRLTPTEAERLQGFPDGWTEGLSDTQRYKTLGNAVTVNVIREIVKRLI